MPDDDIDAVNEIRNGVKFVNDNGYLHIKEPTEQQYKDELDPDRLYEIIRMNYSFMN